MESKAWQNLYLVSFFSNGKNRTVELDIVLQFPYLSLVYILIALSQSHTDIRCILWTQNDLHRSTKEKSFQLSKFNFFQMKLSKRDINKSVNYKGDGFLLRG